MDLFRSRFLTSYRLDGTDWMAFWAVVKTADKRVQNFDLIQQISAGYSFLQTKETVCTTFESSKSSDI